MHLHRPGVKCLPARFPELVAEHEDGTFIIAEPAQYEEGGGGQNLTDGRLACSYRQLGGTLFPDVRRFRFEGDWRPLPLNRPFTVQLPMFAVKCFVGDQLGKWQ